MLLLAAVLALAAGSAAAERTLAEMMKQTVDPAANAFWAAGNDAPEGESKAAADARWAAAFEGAAMMREYGELMMTTAQIRPGDWNRFAKLMADAGEAGEAAVQKRDAEAAFNAGGQLYEACSGCHAKYIPGRS
ncbi:MAG TPA: hypothetical protein VIO94_02480 [Phenylobacterium sp.]